MGGICSEVLTTGRQKAKRKRLLVPDSLIYMICAGAGVLASVLLAVEFVVCWLLAFARRATERAASCGIVRATPDPDISRH